MSDNKQKSMLGCLLWSGLGVILLFLSSGGLALGVRTVAALPAWIGIVKRVQPEDIIAFDAPGTIEVTLDAGPHMIISQWGYANYDFEIVSVENGQSVLLERETDRIEYELENFEGKLIYHFDVPKNGRYRIREETTADNTLKIAPNYSTRNQIVIAAFFGACGLLGVWWWRQKLRAEHAQRQEVAQAKSAKWETFMNSEDDGQNQ